MDQTLSMSGYISDVCRSSFLSLRHIGSIRPLLDWKSDCLSCKFCCYLASWFCNSATQVSLTGITSDQINRLQRVEKLFRPSKSLKRESTNILHPSSVPHWASLAAFGISYSIQTGCIGFPSFRGYSSSIFEDLSATNIRMLLIFKFEIWKCVFHGVNKMFGRQSDRKKVCPWCFLIQLLWKIVIKRNYTLFLTWQWTQIGSFN